MAKQRAGPRRTYGVDGRAGCVSLRRSRATGTTVGIYASFESGIETDSDLPWTTVCEDHGNIVCHSSLRLARDHAPHPDMWCTECQSMLSAPGR